MIWIFLICKYFGVLVFIVVSFISFDFGIFVFSMCLVNLFILLQIKSEMEFIEMILVFVVNYLFYLNC